MRPERADLERSFVNVSTEAEAIREDARHMGTYVNNNEKCDDFEVIDDGSQQGGIRNFEDKSFEKSGRSSLMSSARTEGVDEDLESDVPLEISVDLVKPVQKDEYDIVNMDDSSKPSSDGKTLDVSSMVGGDTSPMSDDTSDINVNKYLMGNDDDDDSSAQHGNTFNVDRYFANDDVTSVIDVPAVNDVSQADESTESILPETLKDSNEDMKYETVEYSEVASPPAERVVLTDDTTRCSPYVEVESEGSELTTVSGDVSQLELSQDIVNVESIGESTVDDFHEINTDESGVPAQSVEESSTHTAQEMNVSISPNAVSDQSELKENAIEDLSQPSVNYELPPRDYDASDDAVDGAGMSVQATAEESELLETLEDKKPTVVKAGVFSEQSPLVIHSTSISEQEKTEVHKNVVDLYDQIAEEASSTVVETDSADGIPSDATFGVFGITGKAKAETTTDPPAGNTDMPADADSSVEAGRAHPAAKKNEPWLVRVESFNAPRSKAPEIQVVNPEENRVESPEADPVPKERKKKKKKKKAKEVEKAIQPAESEQANQEEPVPSAPELLGFEKDPSPQPSPEPSLKQRLSTHAGDIPQQFLDVSNELIGDSTSDVSDTEHEEGSKKKREGSKKGNKKESCKTQ